MSGTEPKTNIDPTRSDITNDKRTWSSPKSGDGSGYVKLDQDDLHPERLERLGDFLASQSIADEQNIDATNNRGSHFEINPPLGGGSAEENPYTPFVNPNGGFEELLDSVAKDIFDNWTMSNVSFDDGIREIGGARENSARVQDGHSILREGSSIVQEHIDNAHLNSRWRGIQMQRFDPNLDSNKDGYQVKRSGEGLDPTGPTVNPSADGTKGSRFSEYQHINGTKNINTRTNPEFWNEYFEKMKQVGAKITLGAQGYKDASAAGGGGSFRNVNDGPAGVEDLLGSYSRVPLSNMDPKETFADDAEEYDILESHKLSGESWGQMYSWAHPFEEQEFFGMPNSAEIVGQLMEIWLACKLKQLIISSLFHVVNMLASHIQSPGQGFFTTGASMQVPWNRNYYSPDVQSQPGTAFFPGQSGFNHAPMDAISRGLDALNGAMDGVNNGFGRLAATLAGGALNQTGLILEEDMPIIGNMTRNIMKELNIYIPRHTLSQMANATGYNDGNFLSLIAKGIDVAFAYSRASTAGMLILSSHILLGDYGGSRAFWKNIFREVVRNKAEYWSHRHHRENKDSVYDSFLKWVGKDDKVLKFSNHLAMIGDLSIARGYTGKLAFPENKVPLDRMAMFPTLRTATNRIKSDHYSSRLSISDLPSLMLLSRGSSGQNAAQKYADYGMNLGALYHSPYYGHNTLYKVRGEAGKVDYSDAESLGLTYKYKVPNFPSRFEPEQVRMMEDQLEAEHMPFYIQDLRTNEIIAFHAFLTSVSDSFAGEWSASKGFGRMEAVQIYGGGSRSIGVSFTLVAMNEHDFNEMWVKINKLTTLVYPQWSRGTLMSADEDKTFVQPFSQVPTASPLCRLRVGDLFTSNYSQRNMARLMGIEDPKFQYEQAVGHMSLAPVKHKKEVGRILTPQAAKIIFKKIMKNLINDTDGKNASSAQKEAYLKTLEETNKNDPNSMLCDYDETDGGYWITNLPHQQGVFAPAHFQKATKKWFLLDTMPAIEEVTLFGNVFKKTGSSAISDLFTTKNPIIKSFESTMGRGIAVAVTGIDFDWKLNSAPWNLEAGERAPRMCDVSLSVIPIHDITPGLDSYGANRAPIYTVGTDSRTRGGDPWEGLSGGSFKELQDGIEMAHETTLNGGNYKLNPDEYDLD